MPDNFDVRILARRQMLENQVWRVWLNRIQGGNGHIIEDYLTVGPKRDRADGISGVAVLPMLENGDIVLVPVHRPVLDIVSWEIPRGFLDPDREPADMAHIELAEEADLSCPPENLVSLGFVMSEPSTIAGKTALFLATNCGFKGEQQDPFEPGLGAPKTFTPTETTKMIADGSIVDATTLAVFSKHAATKVP